MNIPASGSPSICFRDVIIALLRSAKKKFENLNIGLKLATSILNLTHVCSINWNPLTLRKII